MCEGQAVVTCSAEKRRLGSCVMDTHWRFIHVDALGEQLLGKTREQLMGRTLGDAFGENAKLELYPAVGTATPWQASGLEGKLILEAGVRLAVRTLPMEQYVVVMLQAEGQSEHRSMKSSVRTVEDEHEAFVDVERIATRPLPSNLFYELAFDRAFTSLMDIDSMTGALGGNEAGVSRTSACHLLECPRLRALTGTLRETIRVLEKTKGSFKSKELGDLRMKLEAIAEEE
jgi:hypothetical protein